MKLAAVTLDATRTLFHAPAMAAIYGEVLARHGVEIDGRTLGPLIREVWQEFSCTADPRRDRFAAHADTVLRWLAAEQPLPGDRYRRENKDMF